MRHDIDFDLDQAVAMARIEAELNISSTYFFLLGSEHYNLLSPVGTQAVSRILSMGHSLGLHFDCAAYPEAVTISSLCEACRTETRILESWFRRDVEIVSYHRPSQIILTGNPELSAPLPHTYMPVFTRSILYRSDSRGLWRHGHPLDSLAVQQKQPLHLLVHPIWWSEQSQASEDALWASLDSAQERLQASMARNCQVFRAKRTAGDKEQPDRSSRKAA